MDTRHVKFGPDVGQLAKGGKDPVKVVKDFLPLIRHVHLKDWNGGSHWAEYCPLGQVELDANKNPPETALARISKEYLQKRGYTTLAH